MKTERRHELMTNDLAEWLGNSIDKAQPYTRAVVVTLVAVVFLVGLYFYWQYETSRRNERAWNDVLMAMDQAATQNTPDVLAPLAEQYRNSPAGVWAALRMADLLLDQGLEQLFTDRDTAKATLQQAVEQYQLARQSARDPQSLAHACFGLAQAYEGLNKLDDARKEYRNVYEKWPQSDFAEVARQREADLNRDQTKSFYDWFAQQTPRNVPPEMPDFPGLNFDASNLPTDDSTPLSTSGTLPETTPPAESTPASTSESSATPE